ncbi:MAG: energy transducer TonB [Caldimonas sp.]
MNRFVGLVGACALLACGAAAAGNSVYISEPLHVGTHKVSTAADPRSYRIDAARHIYAAYAPRIFKGRLPPLIHAVVVVETTVDHNGRPSDVKLVRGPSHAPDVSAAVIEMIRRVSPLPAPSRFAGNLKFTEIWLITKDGRFQLDALTEGQN